MSFISTRTYPDILLRALSKFIASRKLTILGSGRTDALKGREKGRKGEEGKRREGCRWWKKIERGRKTERRANEMEKGRRRGTEYDEKKGGHGRCCRRKKRRWYKREEVGRKSKTVRKRGGRRAARGTGGERDEERWDSVGRPGRGGVLPAFKTSRQSTDPL